METEELEKQRNHYTNQEQAIKIMINSVYGCLGSPFFDFYNKDIAEAVTLQGQDIIQYSSKISEDYFQELWEKEDWVHKELGISKPTPPAGEVTVYNDTDSCHISFDEVIKNTDWSGEPEDFILKFYEVRYKDYLCDTFDEYSKKWGTTNIQDFELETICSISLYLAKKKYIYSPIWKDPGIRFKKFDKIVPKGVEIVRSDTPRFARNHLKKIVQYIFINSEKFVYKDFVKMIKEIKKEFKLQNIEEISYKSSINDYEKYVLNDRQSIELATGCPIHVRAAAIYNHFLINNPKLREKYHPIKSGNQIKYFYCAETRKEGNVFAFLPNEYPIELGVEYDYEMMFLKTVINPTNSFLSAMGEEVLNSRLSVNQSLF